jgi:hypothetical protein
MVRRLSLASLDSGAESPVYGAEPFRRQVRTGCAATRRNLRHVGHRPAQRKMVCKGHPCIYAADGNPMTWFASSSVVSRGLGVVEGDRRSPLTPRRLRKLTDVHGREG